MPTRILNFRFTASLLLGAVLTTSGCAGHVEFKTDPAFDTYVASLHLEDRSVEDGAALLERDGFVCNAQPSHATACVLSYGHYGGTRAEVVLAPDTTGRTKMIKNLSRIFM